VKGATKKRGTHGLRKRCPKCRKLRKFHEPHGNQGGEPKPSRPEWVKIDGRWVCGFCVEINLGSADDLRALGWSVAVHNDYRQNGTSFTFWLLVRGNIALKGEGRTDIDALNQIRAALKAPFSSKPLLWGKHCRGPGCDDFNEQRPTCVCQCAACKPPLAATMTDADYKIAKLYK
jgi:hypothetical protein